MSKKATLKELQDKCKSLDANLFIDNPNYVEGVEVPEKLQIKNYIQNTLKPKIIKTVNFNYADLSKWVADHRSVPDDNNEPFVIDDFIQFNAIIPASSIIRLALSTKNLISLAKKRKHVCADATYKLIWQGMRYAFYSCYIYILFRFYH